MHAVLVQCNKAFVWNTPSKSLSALHYFRQYPFLIVIYIDLDSLSPVYHHFTGKKKKYFKDILMTVKGTEVTMQGHDFSAFICASVK